MSEWTQADCYQCSIPVVIERDELREHEENGTVVLCVECQEKNDSR
jgi:hypothetical protein